MAVANHVQQKTTTQANALILCLIARNMEMHNSSSSNELPVKPMYVSASKSWLPTELQNMVWHTAFVSPSAQVMKGVSIEILGSQHQWPRKQITTEPGVHARIPMGRSLVNPCSQCQFHGDYGMGGYCGKCRSRPVVVESFYRTFYLGGTAMPFYGRGESPRKSYLRGLQRTTCPICEHTY